LPGASLGTSKLTETEQIVVLRIYFRDNLERDRLAVELAATEAATTQGYLTVYVGSDTYASVTASLNARGVKWEIDEDQTYFANHIDAFFPKNWDGNPDTFYGGYHTVEENYAYMDTLVANYPNLAEKVDLGDTWCKTHPGSCTLPSPTWNGYDSPSTSLIAPSLVPSLSSGSKRVYIPGR
jgi:hypothetical protein